MRCIAEEFVIGHIAGLVVVVHLEVRGPPRALTLAGIGGRWVEYFDAHIYMIWHIVGLVVLVH